MVTLRRMPTVKLMAASAFLIVVSACTAAGAPPSSTTDTSATTTAAPTTTIVTPSTPTTTAAVPIAFVGGNLALGRPVTASSTLPEFPLEMAVDGVDDRNQFNWWSSGEFPPQWIEIDLGAPAMIEGIRLTASQAPPGDTRHLVWGIREDGTSILLHEFSGATDDAFVLEYAPEEPWEGIRRIRIETVESPSWVSWREIAVFGTADVPLPPQAAPADVIYFNGAVVTMERDLPFAEALAVSGDEIVAVGSEDEVMTRSGPDTLLVDLEGRALLPGFIDSHAHWIGDRGFAGIETAQEAVAAAARDGWTTISEQFVNQERLDELVRLDQAGELPIRVNAFLPVNFHDDKYGVWFSDLEPGFEYSPRLRIAGAKVFVDRSDTSSMYLTEDYANTPGYRGRPSWTQDELTAMFSELAAGGWQITVHTAGDAAADLVLEAFDSVLDGESNDAYRYRIEHAVVLRDDQIERIRELGLIVSMQLTWLNSDWPTIEFWSAMESVLGPERTPWLGRWRDLLDAGVKLIGSTDTPWSPAPTTKALHEVVTRIGESGDAPRPWMLDQRITIEEALRLITIDAAYGTFQEDIKGSLAPGKLADLVILSQNPLDVDTEDLPEIDIVATIVGGETAYCAPGLSALCG
jgi:predicted amidohydrolase YtcJ